MRFLRGKFLVLFMVLILDRFSECSPMIWWWQGQRYSTTGKNRSRQALQLVQGTVLWLSEQSSTRELAPRKSRNAEEERLIRDFWLRQLGFRIWDLKLASIGGLMVRSRAFEILTVEMTILLNYEGTAAIIDETEFYFCVSRRCVGLILFLQILYKSACLGLPANSWTS